MVVDLMLQLPRDTQCLGSIDINVKGVLLCKATHAIIV